LRELLLSALRRSHPTLHPAVQIQYNVFRPSTSKQVEALGTVERTGENMEKPNNGKLDTTLGELIAAASEVAFEYSDNDREAYNLAQLALIEILRKTSHPLDLNRYFEKLSSPSQLPH
jgi:hypothetical protein